jgi:hypothetical protein
LPPSNAPTAPPPVLSAKALYFSVTPTLAVCLATIGLNAV